MNIEVPDLPAATRYAGVAGCVQWVGYHVQDEVAFRRYLAGPVRDRLRDEAFAQDFEEELRDLATTHVATEYLERFFDRVPSSEGWEVGEALAECILEDDTQREVVWPWNTARDRRTPRASLPGADLVGFCREGDDVWLLVGEVKTSSERRTPPGVMWGTSGIISQLRASATQVPIQQALLKWLRARCHSPEHRALYRKAAGRYVDSCGKALLFVGVLLRDTSPDARDVESRAASLARALATPTRAEVLAWYLPLAIDEWDAIVQGGAP